jgi:hypothetical protein
MYSFVLAATQTLNDLLTAGIAITAFSLLLYALSFNLRDRVARSFAFLLMCVAIVYLCDTLASVVVSTTYIEIWYRLQWLGIAFLPAAYLHLSDAILATTGRPSRGRRRLAVRLSYLVSFAFILTIPFSLLVGPLVQDAAPAPHLGRTWLTWVFTVYYVLLVAISWTNLWRAYQRTITTSGRRRMVYLLAGSLAPALGSFPYLLFGSNFAAHFPLIFWLAALLFNLIVSVLLVLMAYAVAFFGVPWPDRVVKRRLFKWLMRGPVTASSTLALMTVVRRVGLYYGVDLSPILPAIMVAAILIFEHLITLAAPVWERWLFYGKDRSSIELLQSMEDRLLTVGDLQQFLEALLAAVCDRLQADEAFIATLEPTGVDMLITIGQTTTLDKDDLSADLLQVFSNNGSSEELFHWGDYLLVPLNDEDQPEDSLLGLLGVKHTSGSGSGPILEEEQAEALALLSQRAALALRDRLYQQQLFSSLEALSPQIERIQRLRAATRYDEADMLTAGEVSLEEERLSQWVKDALTHYWGGPKLTQSPLLRLRVVQQSLDKYDENPANALRGVLRQAIEHVRPQGERRLTGEWILYNLLEMKFMEGRKVREIAMRLAMSEADLYRKQRVAIDAVANAIVSMEHQATDEDLPIGEVKKHSPNKK